MSLEFVDSNPSTCSNRSWIWSVLFVLIVKAMSPLSKMVEVRQGNSDFCVAVTVAGDVPLVWTRLILDGWLPSNSSQADMTLNGSGVRDIARVLHISTRTVIAELKKSRCDQCGQSTSIRTARPATSWARTCASQAYSWHLFARRGTWWDVEFCATG